MLWRRQIYLATTYAKLRDVYNEGVVAVAAYALKDGSWQIYQHLTTIPEDLGTLHALVACKDLGEDCNAEWCRVTYSTTVRHTP
jgi:hypothetical protein